MVAGLFIVALAVSAACGAGAASLSAPPHADREASRDIPLGAAPAGTGGEAGTFRIVLEFEATPSNNVQFAVGRDCFPADGKLDAAETCFEAGWRRNCFALRPRGLAERFESPDASAPGPKTLVFQTRRTASDGFTNAAFTVNGLPLAFPFPPSPAPDWLLPPWDILRVTSRGEAVPAASFSVRYFPDGVTVILK
jgi:hypothetical protein